MWKKMEKVKRCCVNTGVYEIWKARLESFEVSRVEILNFPESAIILLQLKIIFSRFPETIAAFLLFEKLGHFEVVL